MNCFDCDRPAGGVCKFCGRGVCKDHYSESIFIIEMLVDRLGEMFSLPVEGVLKCKHCRPIEDFVSIKRNINKEGTDVT